MPRLLKFRKGSIRKITGEASASEVKHASDVYYVAHPENALRPFMIEYTDREGCLMMLQLTVQEAQAISEQYLANKTRAHEQLAIANGSLTTPN